LGSLGDKLCHTGHFKGTGDTIGDIEIEIDAKFFGGGRYGHKCIPCLGAIKRVKKGSSRRLTYDGILDCFPLLSQSMVFLKVFFHSLHNPAGRRTVATESEFYTDYQ
jgi:hypothetical protein